MRQRLEYALVWLIVKSLGSLPRPLARAAAISLAWIIYFLHVRLRQVGMRNLALAFPEKSAIVSGRAFCAANSPPSAGSWPNFAFFRNTRWKMSARSWSTTDLKISRLR